MIVQLSREKELDQQLIVKFLEKQESQRNRALKKVLYSAEAIKLRREQDLAQLQKRSQGKLVFAIKKSLRYVSLEDGLLNLLLLSKNLRQQLQRLVYKQVLVGHGSNFAYCEKQRVQIWFALLKISDRDLEYAQLLEQTNVNKIPQSCEEIIQQDIQRYSAVQCVAASCFVCFPGQRAPREQLSLCLSCNARGTFSWLVPSLCGGEGRSRWQTVQRKLLQ